MRQKGSSTNGRKPRSRIEIRRLRERSGLFVLIERFLVFSVRNQKRHSQSHRELAPLEPVRPPREELLNLLVRLTRLLHVVSFDVAEANSGGCPNLHV